MAFIKDQHSEDMKKKLKDTFGFACVASIIMACAFTDEAGDPCSWNYVLLGLAVVFGLLSTIPGNERRRQG